MTRKLRSYVRILKYLTWAITFTCGDKIKNHIKKFLFSKPISNHTGNIELIETWITYIQPMGKMLRAVSSLFFKSFSAHVLKIKVTSNLMLVTQEKCDSRPLTNFDPFYSIRFNNRREKSLWTLPDRRYKGDNIQIKRKSGFSWLYSLRFILLSCLLTWL